MMAAAMHETSLIERLPAVRGRLSENAALAGITWFRVGGPAEVMFRPADRDDLLAFLAAKPADVAVTVIGVGSNLLVRDGGIPGVVIRLGRGFADIEIDGTTVQAGAAALDVNVARTAAEAGVAGLEFLVGVPGTVGGALRMNAGAYGREMVNVTLAAEAIDASGRIRHLMPEQLGFTYRHSTVPEDWIFLSATLGGYADSPGAIAARMGEIQSTREASQPIRTRTGGSTFANPTDPKAEGRKAWQLIDEAGCRGMRRGGAMVSEKHCNFLINTGTASAADLESLGEEVRRRVFEATGVSLQWEIRRVGLPGPAHPGEARS
jgi:UDP-N-acetylmuramate dehydrogenase